jgi:ABC-type lipoprotein release transport system permease subunit
MMLLKLAWKNVWRSHYRSLVVITAITLGVWAGIFLYGFFFGMFDQRMRDVIENETSHLQIHQAHYKDDYDVHFYIANGQQILEKIKADTAVKAVTGRILCSGMVASPATAVGVKINGVDPTDEEQVTKLAEKIKEGGYFAESLHTPIIISEKTADKLKVKLHSKIVLTFQAANGEITSGAFRVAGMFHSNNSAYDQDNVFIRREELQALVGDSVGFHEIAVLLKNQSTMNATEKKYQAAWPAAMTESWREIVPEIAVVVDMFDQLMGIFMLIILLSLAFGIINTMLMAIMERTREIGMLMAIGMNKTRIFFMIVYETIFLALTGGPLGLLLGYSTIRFFARSGIDLASFSKALAGFGISNMVYPQMAGRNYWDIFLEVLLVALLASIYPAYKALKLNPVNAIRKI